MKKRLFLFLAICYIFVSFIPPVLSLTQVQADLTSYFNLDGFSYDTGRSDGDYDNLGYTYAAELINTNPTFEAVSYTLGPMANGAKNSVAALGQTINLPQGEYSSLRFLGSATNADKTGIFRIIYSDNTYSDTVLTIRDWCYEPNGNMVVQTMAHRHYPTGDREETNRIFAYYLSPAKGKTVTGLMLPNNQDIHLLALTLVSGTETPEAQWLKVDDPNAAYSGGWSIATNDSGYQGSEHSSDITGSAATFTFNGTGVRYYGSKKNNAGNAQIYLDDSLITAIDCYNSVTQADLLLYELNGLTNKTHTLTIKVAGTKNPASSGTVVTCDAFAVFDPDRELIPPVTSSDYQHDGEWVKAPVTINLIATDEGSGVDRIYYRLNGGDPVAGNQIGFNTDGVYTVEYWATDRDGNSETPKSLTVKLDQTMPVISNLQPADGAQINLKRPVISAGVFDELSGIDPASVRLTLDGQIVNGSYNTDSKIVSYTPVNDFTSGNHSVTLNASDIAGNPVTASGSFMIVVSDPNLPPDPAEVAPALDPTIVSDMKTATSFLYTGENPIQTGVDVEQMEAKRAAVIRGKVLDKEGQPLTGVKVSILDHSEFGETKSRADGMFDLAVNGGGYLTVKYEKDGYLNAQRQIDVPWQDYIWAPEVILLQKDPNVTNITVGSDQAQVARGSVATDSDGIRQATLIIPGGTQVTGYSGNSLKIRATEFTVGPNGPKAMPAQLPANSAYTYCVDLSADESGNVQFSQPVYFYVENFLNFPVGGNVPTGYYDEAKGVWIPSDNGVIIRVLSVTDGLAEVDVAGNGAAADTDTLIALGFTDAERQQLATLYQSGQSLWRVPIKHFSSWDCNWGWGPPADAITPNGEPPTGNEDCPNPNMCYIERETQVLREAAEISGTPFTLNYSSDRVPGRIANYTLEIPLSGNTVPASLKRIDLEINIAGQQYFRSFSNISNQGTYYTWNGKNGYGQMVAGKKQATIKIGYVYDGSYQITERFGYNGQGTIISTDRAAFEITLGQSYSLNLGTPLAGARAFNGWSLNVHHFYDSVGKTLYLGDGSKRSAENIATIINTIDELSTYVDGALGANYDVAVGPDGSIYTANGALHRILRMDPNGIVTTVAGTKKAGYNGDGGPATQAMLNNPYGIAVGPDGNIYIADSSNNRIRRVDEDGIIATVAGTGVEGYSGDGSPAVQASLAHPRGVTIGPDGSIYIVDTCNHRIRRVGTDGIITTVAGTRGSDVDDREGGPATKAFFDSPERIAIGPDGSIYIADLYRQRIRRVGTDGIITTVAGTGNRGYNGDGGLATKAWLNYPKGIAVGSDGSIYITDRDNCRIRRIGTDGIITTVAGPGIAGRSDEGGPAIQARLSTPYGVTIGPDAILYFTDIGFNAVRRIISCMPEFSAVAAVTAQDGSELYQFDANGRHLKTIDTLTGTVIYQFGYDQDGQLTSITDLNGNVTAITRSGNQTVITAPFGQETTLAINSDDYLEAITNPANETRRYTYYEGGLLASIADPKGQKYQFEYDSLGRAIKQLEPDGGSIILERSRTAQGYQVEATTAKDQTGSYVTTYSVEKLSNGAIRRVTAQNGVKLKETIIGTDDSETTTFADGTMMTVTKGPDPRFGVSGMQAPIITGATITTPSGLKYQMTGSRTAVLSEPGNPFSVTKITDTTTINGKTYTTVYDATAQTITSTTPMGRKSVTTLDERGRVVRVAVPGLAAVVFEYDERGRLMKITNGEGSAARTSSITYNSLGYVASTKNPLGRSTQFSYDAVGRVLAQTLPDGNIISFSYDANGNVTTLTPPGKLTHGFSYTLVDLEETYTSPEVGAGNNITEYGYNLAKQPTLITRPDGQIIGFEYDTMGRLLNVLLPSGEELAYVYNATTGMLNRIIAPDSGLSFSFDGSLLKKTSWTGTIQGSVEYQYDNDFKITSQTVNESDAVSYTYDDDGLLKAAGDLTLTRDIENGMLTGTSLGNVTDNVTYNSFGDTETYQTRVNGGTVFATNYENDALGRITAKTETVNGESHSYSYIYDSNGQLTDVYRDGSLYGHYEYDSNGNRIAYNGTNGTASGVYDAQDRMLSYGGNTYQYTANGELKSKTNSEGTASYTYDVLGNLTEVNLVDGTKITYVIDGANRRIGKKVNGALVQGFLYQNGLNPVAELDGSGNVVSRFVYGTRSNVPDYMIKGGVTYRIVSDHLGNLRLVVNTSTGDIVQKMEYDEFGRVINDTNPGFQPFGFAGGIYDSQTGLVRFGARDYDAETGRWARKDSIGFAGGDSDLYGYCFNDPVNLIDESGFHAKWPSYIPFFGWGWTLGEGIYHAFGGQDGECHDWDEWQLRMTVSTMSTVSFGEMLVGMGFTGGETVGRRGGAATSSPYGNTPSGRPFTKHYGTETGPKRNIPVSLIDDVIDNNHGVPVGGGKTVYYSPDNNVTVVTGNGGSIVSVHKGLPRKGQY